VEKEIGKVTHFFNKISVAVVSLVEDLAVNDTIHFADAGRKIDFTQKVTSMQVDHQEVTAAKAKSEAAIKVDQPVHEGTVLLK